MWSTSADLVTLVAVTLVAVAQPDTGTDKRSAVPQTDKRSAVPQTDKRSAVPQTDKRSAVPQTSEFTRALFNALGQANTSLVISPYSLVSSLIQIPRYADEDTAAKIMSVLGMQMSQLEQIMQEMHRLSLALHESVARGLVNYLDPKVMIANGSRFVVLESIGQLGPLNVTDQVGAYPLDFVKDFVSEHTDGLINILLPLEALGVNTIVVVDAMIVQAQWHDLFNRNQTSRHAFKSETPDGYVDTEVDMMTGVKTALWGRHDDLRVDMLQLPLRDPQLVFAIVLPHDTEGLTALERTLMGNGNLLERLSQGLTQTRVRVGIPYFQFETTLHVKELQGDFSIARAFNLNKADFRKFSNHDELSLYDIVHVAAIEVNEDGILPVSQITPLEPGTPPEQSPGDIHPDQSFGNIYPEQSLVADHPFLFFIKHNGLGQVLMAGKYLGPGSNLRWGNYID